MARDQRRLAAIISADVVGYSSLMGQDESRTLAALKAHRRELFDPKIAEYGGRIAKTTGDGLLLDFSSVLEAVRCAVDVQRGMVVRNAEVPADEKIEFRIGINVGDIIIDSDDIFGDGVDVAARLQTLAEPGGICVSKVVRDQVLDKLSQWGICAWKKCAMLPLDATFGRPGSLTHRGRAIRIYCPFCSIRHSWR